MSDKSAENDLKQLRLAISYLAQMMSDSPHPFWDGRTCFDIARVLRTLNEKMARLEPGMPDQFVRRTVFTAITETMLDGNDQPLSDNMTNVIFEAMIAGHELGAWEELAEGGYLVLCTQCGQRALVFGHKVVYDLSATCGGA